MKEGINYFGKTYKKKTGCGNIYIIFGRDPESKKLVHIRVHFGKGGGCASAVMADMNTMFKMLIEFPKSKQVEIINEMKGNVCQFLEQSCRLVLAETIYKELLSKEDK